MNGIFVTTGFMHPRAVDLCIHSLFRFSPDGTKILLIDNPNIISRSAHNLTHKYPDLLYSFNDRKGHNLTAAWNDGFKILKEEGCDVICCANDDILVNETWPNLFKTARQGQIESMFGPVSDNPGVDYTGYQKRMGAEDIITIIKDKTVAGTKGKKYFCLNGFCFALRSELVERLIDLHGSVMDEDTYPWGGQEENLGERIHSLGGVLTVVGTCFIEHKKFSDWRRLGLHKRSS